MCCVCSFDVGMLAKPGTHSCAVGETWEQRAMPPLVVCVVSDVAWAGGPLSEVPFVVVFGPIQ